MSFTRHKHILFVTCHLPWYLPFTQTDAHLQTQRMRREHMVVYFTFFQIELHSYNIPSLVQVFTTQQFVHFLSSYQATTQSPTKLRTLPCTGHVTNEYRKH